MFPLNGGGSGPLMGRPTGLQMQPTQQPMMQRPAQPAPAGPQGQPVQSPAAQAIAVALQAILREGITPAVQTALEGFFLTLQKLHQSASPTAPQQPPMGAEQMGFSALPNAAAHSAPQPGGRY